MRTIIHDLNDKEIDKFGYNDDDIIINATDCENSCTGCFSCWVKHPTKCMYNDLYSDIPSYLKNSDELVLISKNRYGCYSNNLKRVLERCIGYVLPHFTIREGKIHHVSRYKKQLFLKVYFYGDITTNDKECLYELVKANSINLNCSDFDIKYIEGVEI